MMAGDNFLVNGSNTKEESDANIAMLSTQDQIKYNMFIDNKYGGKDLYEVKSEYTLNINLEINELKFQSVRDSGYNFNLKIY